ncbi:MAG TPA: hypothetical protein VK955_00605, partial [Xanthobacteraceae bacterium]|nr:hypothetical protein [Xanthobacteraceae bacterium]
AFGEYRKDAIAQRFDDTAPMRFADTADPLRQPRHGLGGARVPHSLEDSGTSRQIGKYDSGIGAHVVQFLVALAVRLWQSGAETRSRKLKSGRWRTKLLLFHFDTRCTFTFLLKSRT